MELLIAAAALLLAALLLALFLFWRRRRAPVKIPVKIEEEVSPEVQEEEPTLEGEPLAAVQLPEAIQIIVTAGRGAMEGAQLAELFHAFDLKRERDGLFYRRAEGYWFGVANASEEGRFPRELPPFTTRGVVLFCYPRELADPLAAFEEMVAAARRIRSAFDGLLLDEKLQPLSEEAIEEIRKKLREGGA